MLAADDDCLRMFPGRGGGGRSEVVREMPLSARIVFVGDVLPFTIPLCCWAAAAAAAATACCCWISFLEALPRFFLSRAYSHFSVKSDRTSTNHAPKENKSSSNSNHSSGEHCSEDSGELTDTVLTRKLSVAFRPELVTLVASPTNSPPDRPGG